MKGQNEESTILHSGKDTKHKFKLNIEGKKIIERLITARSSSHPFNVTIIQVYAPTVGAREEEIDKFYAQLQETTDVIDRRDILICIRIGMPKWELKEKTGKKSWGNSVMATVTKEATDFYSSPVQTACTKIPEAAIEEVGTECKKRKPCISNQLLILQMKKEKQK